MGKTRQTHRERTGRTQLRCLCGPFHCFKAALCQLWRRLNEEQSILWRWPACLPPCLLLCPSLFLILFIASSPRVAMSFFYHTVSLKRTEHYSFILLEANCLESSCAQGHLPQRTPLLLPSFLHTHIGNPWCYLVLAQSLPLCHLMSPHCLPVCPHFCITRMSGLGHVNF